MVRPLVVLAVSVPATLVGLAMVATTPATSAEAERYLAAPECGEPGHGTATCWNERGATVTGIVDRGWFTRRGSLRWGVNVRYESGDEQLVDVRSRPQLGHFDEGDAVRVRFWEGRPARLTSPAGVSVETDGSPVTHDDSFLPWGLAILAAGAGFTFLAVDAGRRHGTWVGRAPLDGLAPRHGRLRLPVALGLFCGIFAMFAAEAWFAVLSAEALGATAAAGLAIGVALGVAARRVRS